MGRRYSLDPLADLVTGAAEETDDAVRERPELALTDRRLEALDLWSKDPWSFLTGTDPDTNQPIIRTIDQRDKKNPIKAFPSHLAYLHYYIEVMEAEPYIATEKCSQMIVSTITLLRELWAGGFKQAHKTLLSKHKEEEASQRLDEKIRQVWLLMPDWLRAALPLSLKPKNKITWGKNGSTILGLPENAAAADARGQTYNTGLIDEAEYQDVLGEILTAMLPRAGQVIFWSTPGPAGEGARVFREYLKDDPIKLHPHLVALKKKYAHVKGVTLRRNEDKNVTIVKIEHTADPEKRKESWLREAAKPYPSMAQFRREILLDRTSNAGRPFYPAFAENPRRYVKAAPGLIDAPIIRGWDFGGRNPACLARGTRVLRADLRWVPVESLKVGTAIVAFDENPAGGSGGSRCWRIGEVLSTESHLKPCLLVSLDDGTEFTCSTDHRFLVVERTHEGGRSRRNAWARADNLRVGAVMPKFFEPWPEPSGYDAGWVGGFYDGEGSLSSRPHGGLSIDLAQVRNGLLDRLFEIIEADGFVVGRWEQKEKRPNQQDTERTSLQGGWNEVMRFLGTYRPERLIEKHARLFRGRGPHMQRRAAVRVKSIEMVGQREVIVLETSASTYLAEGFGHHNCVWGQWSKRSRRFWVLREILGKDIDTYAFRDVVKYLSGQMALESLVAHNTPSGSNRAYELLAELSQNRSYPAPPWFAGSMIAYVDFAGHEAVRPGPGLSKAGDPKVAAEVLAAGDIYVLPQYTFQRSRTQVINGLSRVRNDGMPGIMLDPACPILIKGLTGEIVYAKGTPGKPDPNEPVKDSIYSHLHEALGYALVNTVALDHADYFATTADGELPPAELDEDESEVIDSYITGGEL